MCAFTTHGIIDGDGFTAAVQWREGQQLFKGNLLHIRYSLTTYTL